jgi:mRNA interferase MazF
MGATSKEEAMTACQRGEIYYVAFDPAVGSEVKKTRPALVLQNNHANRTSPIVIVAPLTSKPSSRPYPTDVVIRAPEGGLSVDSAAQLNLIRAVDRRRLGRRLGAVSPDTMRRVNLAIQVSLGLVELPISDK